ncbi:MAG: enoyl-CoA hydratase/isomerase family protein, partial [Acidimicrobiales bacterium]
MTYETITLTNDGPVAAITLNRPEKANAIDDRMLAELDDCLDAIADDSTARVVLIRGTGRGFSGGHDRNARVAGVDRTDDVVADRQRLQALLERMLRIWDFPKPTIAAVHGYCIGAAAQLCGFCDITVVADDAQIGVASIPTGAGFLAPIWALLVGPKRAKQLTLDYGSRIDGRTAVQWGWANTSVPASEVDRTAMDMAKRIARAPSDLLLGQKLAINRVVEVQG